MMYRYRDYGLHIASEIALTQLHPDNMEMPADVHIMYGTPPEHLEDPMEIGEQFEAKSGALLLDIEDAGKFLIQEGSSIVVQPYGNTPPENVGLYLIESCLAAILHQRGRLPLHGSAMWVDGKGIVLSGDSGAGKSTLAKALSDRGHAMMTDDVVSLEVHADRVIMMPGYACQKLWMDSATHLGVDMGQTVLIDGIRDKVFVPASHFHGEPVPLSAMFIIEPRDDAETVRLEKVTGRKKMGLLIENTYLCGLLHGMGVATSHFAKISSLMRLVDVFLLIRPQNGFTLEEQILFVLDAIG